MQEDSGNDIETTVELAWIASIISFIGIIFIFGTFISSRYLRSQPTIGLVINLVISDTVLTIVSLFVLIPSSNDFTCSMLGYIRGSARISSMLWTGAIAHAMRAIFLKGDEQLRRNKKHYQVVCYILPFIVMTFFYYRDDFGDGGVYCSVRQNLSQSSQFLGYVLTFDLWFLVVLIYSLYVYVRVISSLRQSSLPDSADKQLYQLFFLSIRILLLVLFRVVLDRMMVLYGRHYLWLHYMYVINQQLQAFISALIYGMNYTIRQEVISCLRNCYRIGRQRSFTDQFTKTNTSYRAMSLHSNTSSL